jgi:hypothetical protein
MNVVLNFSLPFLPLIVISFNVRVFILDTPFVMYHANRDKGKCDLRGEWIGTIYTWLAQLCISRRASLITRLKLADI